ncbi:hypothetical protein FB451DRAFT_1198344 [Mycena latifolia]|nr:hypothetical protein FB451DRAFT_1198344 [Mycena latifolia]
MSPRPPSSFLLSRATNLYALQTRQASQPVTLSYRLNPVGDDCKLPEIKRAQSAVLNPKTLELLNVKATVKAQGSSLQAPQHQEVLPLSKIIVSSGPPGPLSAFLSSPSMSAAMPASVCVSDWIEVQRSDTALSAARVAVAHKPDRDAAPLLRGRSCIPPHLGPTRPPQRVYNEYAFVCLVLSPHKNPHPPSTRRRTLTRARRAHAHDHGGVAQERERDGRRPIAVVDHDHEAEVERRDVDEGGGIPSIPMPAHNPHRSSAAQRAALMARRASERTETHARGIGGVPIGSAGSDPCDGRDSESWDGSACATQRNSDFEYRGGYDEYATPPLQIRTSRRCGFDTGESADALVWGGSCVVGDKVGTKMSHPKDKGDVRARWLPDNDNMGHSCSPFKATSGHSFSLPKTMPRIWQSFVVNKGCPVKGVTAKCMWFPHVWNLAPSNQNQFRLTRNSISPGVTRDYLGRFRSGGWRSQGGASVFHDVLSPYRRSEVTILPQDKSCWPEGSIRASLTAQGALVATADALKIARVQECARFDLHQMSKNAADLFSYMIPYWNRDHVYTVWFCAAPSSERSLCCLALRSDELNASKPSPAVLAARSVSSMFFIAGFNILVPVTLDSTSIKDASLLRAFGQLYAGSSTSDSKALGGYLRDLSVSLPAERAAHNACFTLYITLFRLTDRFNLQLHYIFQYSTRPPLALFRRANGQYSGLSERVGKMMRFDIYLNSSVETFSMASNRTEALRTTQTNPSRRGAPLSWYFTASRAFECTKTHARGLGGVSIGSVDSEVLYGRDYERSDDGMRARGSASSQFPMSDFDFEYRAGGAASIPRREHGHARTGRVAACAAVRCVRDVRRMYAVHAVQRRYSLDCPEIPVPLRFSLGADTFWLEVVYLVWGLQVETGGGCPCTARE